MMSNGKVGITKFLALCCQLGRYFSTAIGFKNQAEFKGKLPQFLPNDPRRPSLRSKNIPFLSGVPEKALADLMTKAKTVRYSRKSVLSQEGENNNALFIIFLGKIKVMKYGNEQSKAITVCIREPRLSYGEIALLPNELRSASVLTLEQSIFAVILQSDFLNWFVRYPNMKFATLDVLSDTACEP